MYDFKKIEKKWQDKWEKQGLYKAEDFLKKPKKYLLVEFPYPSGDGLHVGHCRSYTALDIIARKSRMDGFNVLYPMGWDAFGLPTENYAIKTGKHPKEITKQNTDNFRRQMKSLGFSFDWSREINTTDPAYFKWTQWIFLQLWKKGLAYKTKMSINWCPSCKIGLANEEVIDGKCERCGHEAEKKEMEQWMLRITAYAEKLLEGLKEVDYPERVKDSQINWIGRSEGANVKFQISNFKFQIEVFTTRIDTVFGVSAVVLAPEHPLITNDELRITNKAEVKKYIAKVKKITELDRTSENSEKTGVELEGVQAINPFTGEKVPVWIADYVLAGYGTGAVMMVPAHDTRDFAFAKKYKLPIKEVVTKDEILVDSGEFSGLTSEEARKKMAVWAEKKKIGAVKVNYHLRDWVFSRQHYWGEPIPIVYCEKCGIVPVKDADLPVALPDVKKYEPSGTGESPLVKISDWVNVKCPKCDGKAKRETDTMPNWAGSSWYYLRYTDPNNDKVFADKKILKYWTPVDIYNGGMEHTTLHLLYSRFWHKFLFDEGLVPTSEPYQRRTSHGMVLGEGGIKMSKSKGNVINPDDVVKEYGADTLRVYEMFMGPFAESIPWEPKSIIGVKRFLEKIYNLSASVIASPSACPAKLLVIQERSGEGAAISSPIEKLLHKTIKGVTEDIEGFKFNTAISKLMILVNAMAQEKEILTTNYLLLTTLLAPFAPHLAEELWSNLGNKESIFKEKWPKYNEALAKDDEFELVIQVNGKVRDKIMAPAGISESDATALALASEKIKPWLAGKKLRKIIFTGKLVSIVV